MFEILYLISFELSTWYLVFEFSEDYLYLVLDLASKLIEVHFEVLEHKTISNSFKVKSSSRK